MQLLYQFLISVIGFQNNEPLKTYGVLVFKIAAVLKTFKGFFPFTKSSEISHQKTRVRNFFKIGHTIKQRMGIFIRYS